MHGPGKVLDVLLVADLLAFAEQELPGIAGRCADRQIGPVGIVAAVPEV